MLEPDVPLAPEAQAFMDSLRPSITAGLAAVERIPVSVLLWGPAVGGPSPMGDVRLSLRARLRAAGHLAHINEDLIDPSSPHSIRIQEFMHAKAFELVVCIPATFGAAAEAHEFASHPDTSSKMVLFLDRAHSKGYSSQSLETMSTVISSQIEYYDGPDACESIYTTTLTQAQRIRELKFMTAHKAVRRVDF